MTNPRPVSPEGPAPLDCPFCGEVARLHAAAISLGFYRVGCNNPNCIQPEAFADEKVDAIARWNRRPSRSAGSPETPRKPVGLTCEQCGTTTVPADSLTCTAQFPSCEAKPYYADPAPSPGEAGAPTDSERLDWLGSHPNAFGWVRDYLTFGTSDLRRAIDAARADRPKSHAARSTPAAQET